VLSRFLNGGQSVILLAFFSTVLGYVFGVPIGLIAGYNRGRTDAVLMRIVDVALSFPAILFVLIILSGVGRELSLVVLAIALTHAPRIARIVRGAALEVSTRNFVERAEARGESAFRILFWEITPNLSTPLFADAGVRFAGSVLFAASVGFLGLGLQPPAADWAVMVSENRVVMLQEPYAVLFPVLALACLAVAVSVFADGLARGAGRSVDRRQLQT
jgi:peptide/nickel transport system permease protein